MWVFWGFFIFRHRVLKVQKEGRCGPQKAEEGILRAFLLGCYTLKRERHVEFSLFPNSLTRENKVARISHIIKRFISS